MEYIFISKDVVNHALVSLHTCPCPNTHQPHVIHIEVDAVLRHRSSQIDLQIEHGIGVRVGYADMF